MNTPKPTRKRALHAVAFTAALLCTPSLALAHEHEPALWLTAGAVSTHFDSSKKYNENNAGLGLEYRTSPDTAIVAGQFKNSLYKTTHYAGVNWQPFTVAGVKLGAAIGAMDGYPALKSGGAFIAVIPMATFEGQRLGINVGLIPNTDQVKGALIFQVKFRLY